MSRLRFAVVALAVAMVCEAPTARATPSIQVIKTVPIGTSPLLQTPWGTEFTNVPAVTYDEDPAAPWLIEVENQFSPGGASVTRVGAVGLVPSSPMGMWPPIAFAPGETHADAVFSAMSDGYVYRIDGDTGECIWKTYVGRTTAATIHFPGCTGGVPLPEIQCPSESDGTGNSLWLDNPGDLPGSNWPWRAADVVIYAATSYASTATGGDPDACGTTSDNRVYALAGDTGAPLWVFNTDPTSPAPYAATDTPPYLVNGIAGTLSGDDFDDLCSGGEIRGQLMFGTSDPGTGQDTLFAVSVQQGTGGTLNWSGPVGDVQSSPTLHWGPAKGCQHVYVATGAGGAFESIGITPGVCGGAAVPCVVSSMPLFTFSPFNGSYPMQFYDSASPLFGKLVVADQSLLHVLSDDGPTLSTYCTASALQSAFPALGFGPVALARSIWAGASDRSGNGALVGLEIPTPPPPPPFDCGRVFAVSPQAGTVGSITTDVDPATDARLIYAAVNGPGGSALVVADYSE